MTHNVQTYEYVKKVARGAVELRNCESDAVSRVSLSPFIYFAGGDKLRVERDEHGSITRIDKLLACPGRAQEPNQVHVFPYYAHTEDLVLSTGARIPVLFKEITTEQEFEQLRFLEQFHYLKAKPTWGRQMYLIARPETDEVLGTPLPSVLGCVVLTSPSILSGPRNNLLQWNDREVLKENIDRVVRIARVIVHPEFRGLRLGSKLVHHSVEYCRERWNVKGKRAWFVETVAEMSRYHPFFEQGGLHYIGQTRSHETTVFFDDNAKGLGINQGEGQVMASIRRFKQKLHSQKPYLMASLLPASDPYTERIEMAQPAPLVSGHVQLIETRLPSPITLVGIKAGYPGRSVWDEPQDLNARWQKAADRSYADLQAYLDKLKSLVSDLLKEELWKGDKGVVQSLLPLLRKIDVNVDEGIADLESIGKAIGKTFSSLGHSLEAANSFRGQLARELEEARRQVEQDIKPINLLAERLREDKAPLPVADSKRRSELNDTRLKLQRVSDKLELGAVTPPQKWVTDAFGVRPGQSTVTLSDLHLEIWPGSVVLVVGPSGSGKSTLLSLISGALQPMSGALAPANLGEHVSFLDLDFDPSKPLIDLVGQDAREAVFLLNHVDLAESHLYMKRRDELSHGQRYRAAFAQMLADKRPVWLADEFCAFLDPVTTLTLCKGIRKLVQRQGITFVAAAAKEDYIREALQPDIVIRINAGGQVWPSPKPLFWGLQPDPDSIRQVLSGEPDLLGGNLGRWFHQIGLTEQDPVALHGTRWTKAAVELRGAGKTGAGQFALALAEHLWARDWLFHRAWNRVRFADGCFMASEDWYGPSAPPSQVRYRKVLAQRLALYRPTIDHN